MTMVDGTGTTTDCYYDADGRLSTVEDWNSHTTTFGYNGDGSLTSTTYSNGVLDTNTVDASDRISAIAITHSTTTLASFGYTYTAAGLAATTTDSVAGLTSSAYGYNSLDQVTGIGSNTTAYAYDAANNLTGLPDGSTISYDHAGQAETLTPPAATATAFGFDNEGDRTSETGGITASYSYDQAQRLAGSSTTAGTATYTYNGDGIRTASTDTAGSNHYDWDTQTASVPLLLADSTNDYIYGPSDQVVEQVAKTGGTTSYLHQDRIGSVRLITNASGSIVRTTSYSAYGTIAATSGTTTSRFGYTGQYSDLSGLIYLQARYYDPTTGQFLTVDPAVDTTRSAYGYAGDDPINDTDPTGRELLADPWGPDPKKTRRSFWGSVGHDSVVGIVNFGRGASGGLSDDIANAISSDASGTVPTNRLAEDVGGVTVIVATDGTSTAAEDAGGTAIRFSQRSVNGAADITKSMGENGWVGDPIDVVRMPDGGLTTADNTRLLASGYSNTAVQATIHEFGDSLPNEYIGRFAGPKGEIPITWGEGILNRIAGQGSIFRSRYPFGSPLTGWDGG